MNIDAIKRLTGRIPLDECESRTRACIEFPFGALRKTALPCKNS